MLEPGEFSLMAYADGELDAETAADVEAACAAAPALQTRLDALLKSTALLRAAYGRPAHEPIPDYLIAGIMAHGAEPTTEAAENVVALRPRRRPRVAYLGRGWAAAAAIATLLIGFGGAEAWRAYRGESRDELRVAVSDTVLRQAVNQALETLPNGRGAPVALPNGLSGSITPLRTYVNGEGLYCRDYLVALSNEADGEEHTAAACRHDTGDWRGPESSGAPIGHI